MPELWKNIRDNIQYKKGDFLFDSNNWSTLYMTSPERWWIVVSTHARYMNNHYRMKTVPEKDLNTKDINYWGNWRVRAKNVVTGKYKMWDEKLLLSMDKTHFPDEFKREIRINSILK